MIFFCASFFTLSAFFFDKFMRNVYQEWAKWLAILAIGAFSGLLGYVILKVRKWAFAIIAGWAGVLLGFIITASLVISKEYVFYIIIITCSFSAGFIAYMT